MHTLAQLPFLMQVPLNLWLCDRQCLASATFVVPISARAHNKKKKNTISSSCLIKFLVYPQKKNTISSSPIYSTRG
jgi:hypothetical protein